MFKRLWAAYLARRAAEKARKEAAEAHRYYWARMNIALAKLG